jgi:phenylpyruvate tautomerase PptA (4-oxalocrotonate tautomerase family)
MPSVKCIYSGDSADLRDDILRALSSATAAAIGKPEAVVFAQASYSDGLLFGGSKEPCAFIEVEAVGSFFPALIQTLTDVMSAVAGIAPSRVTITYRDVHGSHWANNGVAHIM